MNTRLQRLIVEAAERVLQGGTTPEQRRNVFAAVAKYAGEDAAGEMRGRFGEAGPAFVRRSGSERPTATSQCPDPDQSASNG